MSVFGGNGGMRKASREDEEIQRLLKLPARTPCLSSLLGKPMNINDTRPFIWMYEQTFRKGVCKFQTEAAVPVILDCGANVGVTVHYWKHLYPAAKVIAFEADPEIYKLLERNCKGLANVQLYNFAVWTRKETLKFSSNHSVGGHLSHLSEAGECLDLCQVPTVRLRDFLDRRIDFMKVDIEGAEHEVIADCADRLKNVEKLFVELHSFADRPQGFGKLLQIIESAGFRFHIHTELPAPRPFLERPVINGKDLRLDVFAFRE